MGKEVAVITNNKVQQEVAAQLEKMGVGCVRIDTSDSKSAKDAFADCKKIVLPFPSTRSNLAFMKKNEALSDYFSSEHIIIGGMIRDDVVEELENNNINYFDYFKNEAYVLKNAHLTSQGALRLLLENSEDFLAGKRVLVTGFGRIGKSLAVALKGLGMKVYVACRREEVIADAFACGFEILNFRSLSGTLFYFDYIFNTVPATVFSYKDISHIKVNAVYFELASTPFGAEKKNFELLGKNYVHGSALPGRYYPKAVAENIVNYVLSSGR